MPTVCFGRIESLRAGAVSIAALLMCLGPLTRASAAESFAEQTSTATHLVSPLDATIPDFEARVRIAGAPWTRKVAVLCEMGRIPCGIEESPDDPVHGIDNSHDSREELGIPEASRTVRQLLDLVLAKHPHYRWEFLDGVLLVTPKPGKEHRRFWKPVLSRRLRQFNFSDTPAGSLLFKACLNAGVIKSPDPRKMPAVQWPMPLPPTGRVSLNLENVTVREAMVAVARADGQMGWKFSYDPIEKAYTLRVLTWGRDSVLSPYWW